MQLLFPDFKATIIDRPAMAGGTTKPCLMSVEDHAGKMCGLFVVKVFTDDHNERGQATANEFFGSILAQEFDLKVPQPAIIELDIDLLAMLRKMPAYRDRDISPGYFFGSQFIEPAIDFSPLLPFPRLDQHELGSVFGFDTLILNWDRSRKPNCFFNNNELVLIDHELIFGLKGTFEQYVLSNGWSRKDEGKHWEHIFLPHLRQAKTKGRLDFDTFEELLSKLNLQKLDVACEQLQEFGIFAPRFQAIRAYLKAARERSSIFKNHLLAQI